MFLSYLLQLLIHLYKCNESFAPPSLFLAYLLWYREQDELQIAARSPVHQITPDSLNNYLKRLYTPSKQSLRSYLSYYTYLRLQLFLYPFLKIKEHLLYRQYKKP